MIILTLALIKANSRIDGNIEDSILQFYGDSAEATVQAMINRDWADVAAEYGEVPAPLKHACLALVEHYYQNRGVMSPTAIYNVPYTIDVMVKPYTRL